MEAAALTLACACIYCIFVWSMQVDRRERRAKAPAATRPRDRLRG